MLSRRSTVSWPSLRCSAIRLFRSSLRSATSVVGLVRIVQQGFRHRSWPTAQQRGWQRIPRFARRRLAPWTASSPMSWLRRAPPTTDWRVSLSPPRGALCAQVQPAFSRIARRTRISPFRCQPDLQRPIVLRRPAQPYARGLRVHRDAVRSNRLPNHNDQNRLSSAQYWWQSRRTDFESQVLSCSVMPARPDGEGLHRQRCLRPSRQRGGNTGTAAL